MEQVVAVDLGFGWVKAMGARGKCRFPSVVAKAELGEVLAVREKGGDDAGNAESLMATIFQADRRATTVVAGKAATLGSSMSTRPFEADRSFSDHAAWLVFLAAARVMDPLNHRVRLAVGLPFAQYRQEGTRERVRRWLEGQEVIVEFHEPDMERAFRFEAVDVYAQGLAGLVAAMEDFEELADLHSGVVMVIDIGTRTTEYLGVDMERSQILSQLSGTIDLGMNQVHQQVLGQLQRKVAMAPWRLHDMEKIIADGYARYQGRRYEVTDMYEEALKDLAAALRHDLAGRWQREMVTAEAVVVMGGGGKALEKELRKAWGETQVFVPADAQFANTRGYWLMSLAKQHAATQGV
ncbi:MAG: ParM/StbA family protein [Clostridiales bacterium]|nr:ParM/StbA family protein [Clostridiales bacterium]